MFCLSVFFSCFFFFSSRRRHTRSLCDWSSDVCSSDLVVGRARVLEGLPVELVVLAPAAGVVVVEMHLRRVGARRRDRKSTRLNSSHTVSSYAVFCLKKKKHLSDERDGSHRPPPDSAVS